MSTDWSSKAATEAPAPKPAFRIPFVLAGLGIGSVLAVGVVYWVMIELPTRDARHRQQILVTQSKIKADLTRIDSALDEFAAKNGGRFPESLDALAALGLPLDPWDRAYVLAPPRRAGASPRVLTYGRDGRAGGAEDDADVDDTDLPGR